MHLVNIQCDNAPERALHLTGEEEEDLVLERSFYTGTTPTNIQHVKNECCFVAIITLYKYKLIKK